MGYKLNAEKGMAVLLMAIITGIVIFTVGGGILLITRYMSLQSFQQARQFNAYVVAESGLNDALWQIQANKAAGKTGINLATCTSSTCTYSSPKKVKLGNSCYNYWFGSIKENGTPTVSTDDYVTVHILAASPYQESGGQSTGDCTLNQVVSQTGGSSGLVNRQRDSKIIAIYADVALPTSASAPPRVLKVHWGQNLGPL